MAKRENLNGIQKKSRITSRIMGFRLPLQQEFFLTLTAWNVTTKKTPRKPKIDGRLWDFSGKSFLWFTPSAGIAPAL
jgi:hypothetical protein